MPVTFRGKSVSNKEVILSFIQLLLSVKLICAFYFERASSQAINYYQRISCQSDCSDCHSIDINYSLVNRKMVNFKPGFSQILSEIFPSSNKLLMGLIKYCRTFTQRPGYFNPK